MIILLRLQDEYIDLSLAGTELSGQPLDLLISYQPNVLQLLQLLVMLPIHFIQLHLVLHKLLF